MRPRPIVFGRATVVAVVCLTVVLGSRFVAEPHPITSPRLQAEATRLFDELARLRGLPSAGTPPRVVIRTRQGRRQFVARELARKFPPARIEAERRALVAWGLIPRDFELRRFLTDLVAEQAAAYYDPVGKVMVLANWLGQDAQREALAHELVHALQDRQIDLDQFLSAPPGKGDAALARQSLIEGEAVALTLDRTLRREGKDLARLPDVVSLQQAIVTSATGPLLSRAPRFLRTLLTFPYAYGIGFIHEFRRRHAWSELSRLYGDPPRSTAQILHPARYLDRREDPLPVVLPDLTPALGPGARRVFEDNVGEVGLTDILREFLGDEVAVGHWRGDRYALWESPSGPTVLLAVSLWARNDDARAFADAYVRLLRLKHDLAGPAATGGLTRWEVGGQAFLVERRGREVLLVEGAPAPALGAIRRAVWAARLGAGASPGLPRTFPSVGESGTQRAPARLRRTMPASITPAPTEISRTR